MRRFYFAKIGDFFDTAKKIALYFKIFLFLSVKSAIYIKKKVFY